MSVAAKRARVVLADDHALIIEGMKALLSPGYDVVGVAEDGRQLILLAERLKPDVIVVDVSMPELNGIDAAKQLRHSLPGTKLLMVSMHCDATFVTEALQAGASGYLVKRSAPQELLQAVDEVLHGRTYITPLVTRDLVDMLMVPQGGPGELFGRLTPRQREVLQLVAEGRSNKEIAAALFVSCKTVEFHRSNIMRALGLHTTAELTRYAVRHGVVSA